MTADSDADVRLVPYPDLVGLSDAELTGHLGEPVTKRRTGDDTWLVFRSPGVQLRVRCAGPPPLHVASWTATFDHPYATLGEAARALGLWPAVAPDQSAATFEAPAIRRPLARPEGGLVHTLTATVRNHAITQISVFDEPPEWL